MFGSLRKIIGNINIVQKGNLVTIEGLPTEMYLNDIFKIWRTSKIAAYMFTRQTSATVTFHQFFLPDILFTLETVLSEAGRGSSFNYRALKKVVEKLKTETWLKNIYEDHDDILDMAKIHRLDVKPFEHQIDFLQTYNTNVPKYLLKGYMLGAVPGSGKTLTGLMLGCALDADVVICIVPKNSVNSVWEDTIANRFRVPVDYWVSTGKEELVWGKSHYVFHYEQLPRAIEFFEQHLPNKPLIILDESHNLNESESQRSQLLVKLAQVTSCNHCVWASGTPIKAVGNEAVPFLSMVDPFFDADASYRFKKIFGKSASRAVDILRNRIGFLTFKVEKANVIKNVVETVAKKVQIPNGKLYTLDAIRADMQAFVQERCKYYIANKAKYQAMYQEGIDAHEKMIGYGKWTGGDKQKIEAYELYKKYFKEIVRFYDPESMKMEAAYCNQYEAKEIRPYLSPAMKETFKSAKSVVKYYQLKVQGEALGRILGKKRMQCNVDMVPYCGLEEEIDQSRKKTVIFTSYVEVVDKVAGMLEESGYKPLRVYGLTNKDLPNIVKRFADDEDANPLIATFQSLSTAVPLTMASTAIMLNSPYRAHELVQARARIDRIDQDGPVTFIDIFLDTGAQPNISTRSGDILSWSRDAVAAIMGGSFIADEAALESIRSSTTELISLETLIDALCKRNPALEEIFTEVGAEEAIIDSKPNYLKW